MYDADGGLLSQRDGAATVLYLPGQQLTVSVAGVLSGVRYYALPGGGTAYRTGSGNAYGYKFSDAHGTSALLLDYTGQNPTWRQFTPFGETRGSAAPWVDNRTFLDKPADAVTGLTNVGARYYDPTIAQFISLDPLFDGARPQDLNGYSYAGENPMTFSDPSGLAYCTPQGMDCVIPDDQYGDTPDGVTTGNSDGHTKGGGTTNPDPNPTRNGRTQSTTSNGGSANGGGSSRSLPPPEKKHGWVHFPSWHTVAKVAASVAVAVAVTAAVAAVCATGVGCVILAAAVAGAASGMASYGTGVALGDDQFSVRGLATAAAVGAVAGVATAGLAAGAGAAVKAVVGRGASAAAEGAAAGAARGAAPAARDVAESGASKSLSKAASCAVNSFSGSTPVVLASGKGKAIAEVKAGDKVKSVNPATGEATTSTVSKTYINTDTNLTDLTLAASEAGTASSTTLHTTSHHRIWDATAGGFAFADDLPTGHRVRSDDGRTWILTGSHSWVGREQMYDITVDGTHTFFAGTPAGVGILVHNCGGGAENLVGGNSGAAARGTAIHNGAEWAENLGSIGGSPSEGLLSGARPDGFTAAGDPIELKPATRSGIRAGTRQLRRYMNEMGVSNGQLWTYSNGPDGVVFNLAAVPKSAFRWTRW